MPNNDLGTAHGRIRIDYDGKGSAAATAALIKMQKQFEQMNQKLGKIEKALTDADSGFKNLEKGLDNNTKAAKRFDQGLFGTHKSVRRTIDDVQDLAQDLTRLYGVFQRGQYHFRQFSNVVRVFNAAGQFNNSNSGVIKSLIISVAKLKSETKGLTQTWMKSQEGMLKWSQAGLLKWAGITTKNEKALLGLRSSISLAGASWWSIRGKVFGTNKAIRDTQVSWIASLAKMVTSVTALGGALKFLNLGVRRLALLERFATSGAFNSIVKGSESMSRAFARLGAKTERVFGKDLFKGFAASLLTTDKKMTSLFNNISTGAIPLAKNIRIASNSLLKFAKDADGLVGGIALLSSSMSGLWQRFQWFFKLPKPLMAAFAVIIKSVLPTALSGLSSMLRGISNLFVGLWDGVKQLTGGLTILPGIFASIFAAVTPLIGVFKGLSDQFKDLFSDDPEKAFEAWAKLPEHLRPVAKAIKDIVPKWKELQKTLQTTAFAGLEDQIKSLADNYFPLFEKGSQRVIRAFRSMKDEYVDFLLATETRSATSSIYANTAGAIQQMSLSIGPASAGLRDMAVIGTKFIEDMSSLGPAVSQQFANWASESSKNGAMMQWMEEATHGVYLLSKGLKELTGAAYRVLTMFKTNSGDNFLQRFADYMTALNKSAKESAITGWIAKVRSGVQNMGANHIEEMKSLFRAFGDAIKEITPFVTSVAEAFSTKFIPAMKGSLWVIREFLGIINALNLSNFVGYILGIAGAAVLLPKVFSTTIDAIKGFLGIFLILKNKEKVINGLSTAFLWLAGGIDKLGGKWSVVSNGLENVTNVAGKSIDIIGRFANTLFIGAAALIGFYALYESGRNNSDAFNKQLESNKKHLVDFKSSLKEAFFDDRGITGSNVMSSISSGLETMMADMEATADKAPGIGDHIFDYFFRMGDRANSIPTELPVIKQIAALFDESDTINFEQEVSVQAKLAAEGLQKIRDAGVDLANVLAMSDTDFQKFIENQRKSGDAGNAAADALEVQRKAYAGIKTDMLRVGTANIELAAGIRQVAEAGGDATAKLQGMKKILEALGIIKTTANDALRDYAAAIDEITKKAQEFAASGIGKDQLVVNGKINFDTEAGRAFYDELKKIGDAYQGIIAANGDSVTAFKEFEAQLNVISGATGIPIAELSKLAQEAGLTSDAFSKMAVSLASQLPGKTPAEQDFVQAFLKMQQMANEGIEIPTSLSVSDPAALSKKINDIVGSAATSVRGSTIEIAPDIKDDALRKIITELTNQGFKFPQGPEPTNSITAPVKVGPSTASTGDIYKNGIAEPERAAADGLAAKEIATENTQELIDSVLAQIEGASDEAKDQGAAFVDAYAAGLDSNPAAIKAAEDMAAEIKKRFHNSPPKKGPLSDHGDAAKWAGKLFGESYAVGIERQAGNVGGAAGRLAGAAGDSIAGTANVKDDKNYKAGKFLGQISTLVDFAENAVQAFTKLTETLLGAAKFASDPLGKGTFFGKRLGFRRDPEVTDLMIAQRKADEAQRRRFQFEGSGRRPDLYDPATGRLRTNAGVGKLVPNPNEQEIANYIIDQAMSLGYSREQANMFLTQAVGESGLKPNASNPNGWDGIFQFDKSTWDMAGGGDVMNAAQNIDNYFKLAAQRGLTTENFKDPSQLGTQVSIGGPLHPENAAKGDLARATAAAQQYIAGYQTGVGQVTEGILSGVGAIPGNLGGVLQDYGHVPSGPLARRAAAVIAARYPEISHIGGSYLPMSEGGPSVPGTHDAGMAIDISIPNWDTPQGKALGKEINAFLQANAAELGIRYTIFDNMIQNVGKPATPFGGEGPSGGHYDHIDIQFQDGASATVNPDGTMSFNVPRNSPFAGSDFGIPEPPEADQNVPPTNLVTRNPDGTFSPVQQGTGAKPGPEVKIDARTGLPWTPESTAEFYNRPENALQYDANILKEGDQGIPGIYRGTEEDLAKAIESQNPLLKGILNNTDGMPNMSTDQAIATANALQSAIDSQEVDTPEGRARASMLQSSLSGVLAENGLSENANPIDQAAAIGGSLSSIAGDIFAVVNSVIESVGATKNIADTLVRGVENTEDLYDMVDQVQSFIQLAADVAGATASIAGGVGAIVSAASAADPSGGAAGAATAVAAVSQIAGLVQSALETVNAVIDLGQEAYRIAGSYFGKFLGSLVGGPAGELMGDVKFLLDQQANQLLAYSQDNAQDKRSHDLAFQKSDTNSRNQMIGNINVYGGPGSDPRDNTRQMMYQVKASTMSQAIGQ